MKARPQSFALEPLEDRTLLATCTVTNLLDVGRGGMSIGSGQGTGDLRFCINQVNAISGPDVIDVLVNGTIQLRRPLPDLASDIDIQGPGSNLLTVRRNTGGDYRIFTIAHGVVALRGLSITNGKGDVGGGIYNQGDLTLEGVTVSFNVSTAGQGGGIYNTGTLVMSLSTIATNTSKGPTVGYGGGIYNTEFGQATINSSNVTGNEATSSTVPSSSAYGGGIYNAGILELFGVSVSSNAAHIEKGPSALNGLRSGFGGGIYNSGVGEAIISSSTITNNIARGETYLGTVATAIGGGIYNEGILDVSETTISSNQTDAKTGYGIGQAYAHGGGIRNTGTMTVRRSTLVNNMAMSCIYDYGEAFSYGGGVSHEGGTATIINSTVISNLATSINAWSDTYTYARGGGVFATAPISIVHSTIAQNTASADNPGDREGGGISGNVTMRNSIVAGNTGGTSPDMHGALVSSGYNLFSNSTGGSGYAPTDLLNVSPLLGPLANNGGPTLTMSLRAGSPAIDAGDNGDAPEWDQRGPGFPRIVNGTIDIGAFEVQATGAPGQPRFLAFLITAESNKDE